MDNSRYYESETYYQSVSERVYDLTDAELLKECQEHDLYNSDDEDVDGNKIEPNLPELRESLIDQIIWEAIL